MRRDNTRKYGVIGAIVVILSVFLFANELPMFHYVLDGLGFFYFLTFLSLIVGLLTAYIISRNASGVDKLRAYLIFGLLSFIPVFGAGSWLNRNFGHDLSKQGSIVSYEPRITSAYGVIKGEKGNANRFRVTFKLDDRLYEKVFDKDLGFYFDEYPQNVVLPLKKGLLGFEVFDIK